jgi:hypothetical protein
MTSFAQEASDAASTQATADLEAGTETRLVALKSWWSRYCRPFSLWYLAKNKDEQLTIVSQLDLPTGLPQDNWLLPEISSVDKLVGKPLIILLTSRLAALDLCHSEDVAMLEQVRLDGRLVDISQGQLTKIRMPFVDPTDSTQRYSYPALSIS